MLRTRSRVVLVAAVVVVALAATAAALLLLRPQAAEGVRSVIFINGDGMGLAQRQAATLAYEGFEGTLAMDELAVLGLQLTSPDDGEQPITDSAAAATAWATGTRTANGKISTSPDGETLTPLGWEAAQAGLATGLVTTAAVTDASPAAFFASVPDRGDEADIAEQYVDSSGLDVVLGGGASVWSDELLAEAEESGFAVVTEPAELSGATGSPLLGLFAEQELWQAGDEGEDAEYDPELSLAEMTRAALDILSEDEDGFLLFVEEEAVDAMGHANNATLMLRSMRALDEAVQVARDYVADHPETLLVVTGDHESGGLTIEDFDEGDEDGPFPVADSARQFALDWTTGSHTGVPVPVTAEGPGSERLAGRYPNTWLHTVLRDALVGS